VREQELSDNVPDLFRKTFMLF